MSALGAANFSYLGNSSTLPGNYYAVVKDNCCPGAKVKTKVVTINPFPELAIAGPCFLCKNQPVTLTGLLANPPSNCTSYIYKWYRNGGLVATQTSTSTTPQLNNVLLPGTYVLTMTCGGCTYTSKPFVLKLCP